MLFTISRGNAASKSDNLAKLTAIPRAPSLLSNLAADYRWGKRSNKYYA
jgi:hypothetical protein